MKKENKNHPYPGYAFAGWYVDKERKKRLNPGGILPKVMTLYQKWVPVYYDITYDLDGGTNDPQNPHLISVESNAINLKPAHKEGKNFAGWEYRGNLIHQLPQGVSHPITLKAIFTETPKIHFKSNGGSLLPYVEVPESGFLQTLPVPKRLGYTFAGWYLDEGLSLLFHSKVKVDRDITLYAKWKKADFKIEYDLDGGINSRRNPETYSYFGQTIELQPARKQGYEFIGWQDIHGKMVDTIQSGALGNLKLKAVFKEIGQ